MANFNVKLNLLKLKNTGTMHVKGKTATKLCAIIPIEENGIFVTEKGMYLDLTAWELHTPKEKQSHIIKQSFSKEINETMSVEEKKNIPIIGNMEPFISTAQNLPEATEKNTISVDDELDNLPF